MKVEQKAKIYGVLGSLFFHALLLLFLWFTFLSSDSIFGGADGEGDSGISVAIGNDDEGGNDLFEPAPMAEVEDLLTSVASQPMVTDVLQTQDIEETVGVPVTSDEKTPEQLLREQEQRELLRRQEILRQEEQRKIAEAKAKKEAQEKKAQEIRDRVNAGIGGSGTSTASTGMGTGNGTGNQGNPLGTPGATNREGTGGGGSGTGTGKNVGGGHSYDLGERKIIGKLFEPAYSVNEEGRVVVTIIVNQEGSVISANIGTGTNIDNPTLRKAAIEAAKRAKFNKGNSGNQRGTITYNFKLQ